MDSKLKKVATKLWGYAVELIAAVLIQIVFTMLLGRSFIFHWIVRDKADVLDLVGLAFALNIAVFAAFLAILATEFGKSLRREKAATEYATAFAFPMFPTVTAAIAVLITAQERSAFASEIAVFALIYAALNCITIVKNVLGVVHLWQVIEPPQSKKPNNNGS
uniref:Uncharacterized protein n=1 Tax=Acidobacterium capsulatum TaxID=33075 RepID=A0A7V4XT60_9BACT